MSWLFISDLHLSPERPDITGQFESCLAQWQGRVERLWILGDLFEVWLGDDAGGEFGARIAAALRRLHDGGTRIALMHGNRDFLLGPRFAAACGAELLADPSLCEIHGRRVLLCHGDALCTDDRDYQRMRRLFRRPAVQRAFLALPRPLRARFARRLRARSQVDTRDKPPEITDVNAAAVQAALREAGVDCMIHGHTHRPAVHRLEVDGCNATRIVLGDWYTQGSLLSWDSGGFALQSLPRPAAGPNESGTGGPAS